MNLENIPMKITVVIGKKDVDFKNIKDIGKGSIIELDSKHYDGVTVLVNGKPKWFGEILVVDDKFGVRITNEITNERDLEECFFDVEKFVKII